MHGEALICRSVSLKSYGGVDQLTYLTRSVNTPDEFLLEGGALGPTQVIINVRACAVGDIDVQVREGKYKFVTQSDAVIGYEIAGVVERVGDQVDERIVKQGDNVVGLLPIDSKFGGYSDYCVAESHFFVPMPKRISYEKAAASIMPSLRAFNALYYVANIKQGEFIFVPRGAHVMNRALIQMALCTQCHVITTVCSDAEVNALQDIVMVDRSFSNNSVDDDDSLSPNRPRLKVIDTRNSAGQLKNIVLEETGHLGVDCVVLCGDEQEEFIDDCLLMMATHASLLSPSQNIDLNIARCRHMFFKGIKFGFLFEQSWVLSTSQQGRFLHMLKEVMNRVGNEVDVPISQTYSLEKIREAHRRHQLTMNESDVLTGRIVIKL
ncbi:hypothetical protein AKO1_006937 [Acrasis kona]|uniref:Enoyl reductase (ER) domain-containing protein n=1 Tax=Acrasis kona TaxID=1008807 RepID=A0AAW2YV22_9EUKA